MTSNVQIRNAANDGWDSIYGGIGTPGNVKIYEGGTVNAFKDVVGQVNPQGKTRFIRNAANTLWIPLDTQPVLVSQLFDQVGTWNFIPTVIGVHYITLFGGGNAGSDSGGGSSFAGNGGGGGEVVERWAVDIQDFLAKQVIVGDEEEQSSFELALPLEVIALPADGATGGGLGGGEYPGGSGTISLQEGAPIDAQFSGRKLGGGAGGERGDEFDAPSSGGNCPEYGVAGEATSNAGGGGPGGGGGANGGDGAGVSPGADGDPGVAPGGGGGGGEQSFGSDTFGGAGARGQVLIEWFE